MHGLTRRLTGVVFTLLAVCAAGVRTTDACTCIMPTCGDLAKADAVFEATVVSIERSAGMVKTARAASASFINGGGMMAVRLKDVKGWRGEAPSVIYTGQGGGDCGYPFRAGERYLIEASRSSEGLFSTGICSMVRPITHAAPLIAYLQALKEAPDQTRVWGTVTRITGWARFDNATTPVKDAQVTLTGPKRTTVSTDGEGRFLVTGLPQGRYSVTAKVNGKALPPEREWSEFQLGRDGALCEELTINVPASGGAQGSVVGEDGAPMKGIFVYLLSADHMDRYGDRPGLGLTLPEGTFVLTELPPGRYVLAMNPGGPTPGSPYLESETPPFVVAEGRTATAPTLRPQRATTISIDGVVRDQDGRPVSGAQVDYWIQLSNGRRSSSWPHPKTDAEGRFVVQLWKDQRYVITVGPEGEPWGRIEFVADGSPLSITARPH